MRRGGNTRFIFSKKKNVIFGKHSLFRSAKFRFTFIHVYIHATLNLKIKPTISLFEFTIPYYTYKNI